MNADALHQCATCGHLCESHVGPSGRARRPRPCMALECTCGDFRRARLAICLRCGHIAALHKAGRPEDHCWAVGCQCPGWLPRRREVMYVLDLRVEIRIRFN